MASNPYTNFFGGYNSKKNAELGAAWEKQNKINNDPILAAQQKANLARKTAADKRAAELKTISDIKVTPEKLKQQKVDNPVITQNKKEQSFSPAKKYTPNFESIQGIKEFQKRNGLKVDGIVGENTIGAMEKQKLVTPGTQAAFIEMKKSNSNSNQAPAIVTPDNANYVSPTRMQEAEDDFTARDMGVTPTQLQQMKQVEAYGPNNPDKDAMYAQIFRPQTEATAAAMKQYDAANASAQPQSQGILSSIGNWFTRERTPEEKAAMNEQVRQATGYDMSNGLSGRFSNGVD